MRLLFFALALLFVTVSGAKAQDQATVVASCGSVTLTAGTQHFRTIDTNGVTCSAGGGTQPTSVWSSSDATANGMTLTNGGLTVTGGSTFASVRGTVSRSSGKWYFEFIVGSPAASSADFLHGLASAGFIPTGQPGASAYSVGLAGWGSEPANGFTINYGTGFGGAPLVVGDVLGMAVDFDAGKAWASKNNVFWSSSSPATGVAPIITFTPATVGPLFPALSLDNTVGSWTLQSTAAALKYAPPSGFKAWDAP